MRALLQRVSSASVAVGGRTIGAIDAGLLALVGVALDDDATDIDWLVRKIVNLRIFSDDAGVMNRSVIETGGALLAISQFTLFASTKKGNRPSWSDAAGPIIAEPAFNAFVTALENALGRTVRTGLFGADMAVTLRNDGPVTLLLDSKMRE